MAATKLKRKTKKKTAKRKTTKKKTAKRKSTKRKNPRWLDRILGRSARSRDSIVITVDDGIITLTGSKMKDDYVELYEILEKDPKKLKIEFRPFTGKGKSYTLNRPKVEDEENILADIATMTSAPNIKTGRSKARRVR